MTELERRALLGDREAQEECTRQGIVLPCPFCGSEKIMLSHLSHWGMWRCWCSDCKSTADDTPSAKDALKNWNTRAAPPVERCGTCSLQNEQFYPLPQSEDGHYYDKLPLLGNKDTIVYIDYLGEEADHGQE